MERTYICIDLKSFYASVECMERGLDPMTTNLVVADAGRTEKTICLAVSPSLKSYGISGRARLFEVVQRVKEVNRGRRYHLRGKDFSGESCDYNELKNTPDLAVSYIVAPPRMGLYMKYSTDIYQIYLKYVAPEDIHVYSIDEVFMDVTNYLHIYKMTPRELAMTIIRNVLSETGITATVGIGTNMYLAKIAMDVEAKHTKADKDGVRIAQLDELSYRQKLWSHTPLTDFWRVGKGYAKKLEKAGIFTMGDIAKASVSPRGEDKLYKMFGVNAELLIDHAWGWEPCTIKDVKEYRPESCSISSGQVLHEPYDSAKGKLIVREMTELLALDLVEKELVTKQLVLTIGYDVENLTAERNYQGEITVDAYGRKIPKHAHGTTNLERLTSSTKQIMTAMMDLFDRIVDESLLIRRVTVVAAGVMSRKMAEEESEHIQLDVFTDSNALLQKEQELEKEHNIQKTLISIKKQYGKNAVLKGVNLEEGATTIDRNKQIGGHKA